MRHSKKRMAVTAAATGLMMLSASAAMAIIADPEPEAPASSCTADQTDSSTNTTGDTVQQGGLINIGGIALQGNNLGLLNNVLCMGNVGNGLLAGVLGLVLGGGGSDSSDASSPDCSADQTNSSHNVMGGGLISGLININGIGLQGNNIGALNNLLCGGNVLNDLTAAVLGAVGRF